MCHVWVLVCYFLQQLSPPAPTCNNPVNIQCSQSRSITHLVLLYLSSYLFYCLWPDLKFYRTVLCTPRHWRWMEEIEKGWKRKAFSCYCTSTAHYTYSAFYNPPCLVRISAVRCQPSKLTSHTVKLMRWNAILFFSCSRQSSLSQLYVCQWTRLSVCILLLNVYRCFPYIVCYLPTALIVNITCIRTCCVSCK